MIVYNPAEGGSNDKEKSGYACSRSMNRWICQGLASSDSDPMT